MSMDVDEEVDINATKADPSSSVTEHLHKNGNQSMAPEEVDSRQASQDTKSTSCSLIFTLQGHKKSVSSLAISPDGTEIVSSGADGLLKIWSLATGSLRATLDAQEQIEPSSSTQRQGISDVAWSSDGKYIVCGGDDKLVRVWHAKRLELLCEFEGHTSFIFCVAFNPNTTLAVSGSFDESVRMWDLQKKRCHRTIAAHSEAVTGVAFNRDGSILASCSYDGLIRLWDAFTGQCLKTLVHGEAMPIGHVVFSPNGFQLLATSLDNSIRLWDMANGRVLKTYVGHQNAKFALKSAFTAWNTSDSNSDLPCFVVAGSEDQKVYLWDLQGKQVEHTLQSHRDVVLCIAAHPSKPIIASASLDRDPCIKVWHLKST
ncbi:will die slowly-like protein [Meira miltonrushii]|uniref:Will die slowly-like protein n=1 Tax=Meira miltonrushii TaxID=1280837 RepID=A0A316V6W2_9BASI|nr:will die slowly-like protein [Meira miltonrushii]PWN32778.1 will die slowly-like protein [Meira miltonrushii]